MLSSRLSPATSPRSVRFRQRPSPLKLDCIMEGREYSSYHSPYSDNEPSIELSIRGTTTTAAHTDHQTALSSSIGSPSSHRSPQRPLVPILKRKYQFEDGEPDDDEDAYKQFEISVRPYHTSCCGTLVRIEHIADWLHDKPSDSHCPSCREPCSLNESNTYSTASLSATKASTIPLRQRWGDSGSPLLFPLLSVIFFFSSGPSSPTAYASFNTNDDNNNDNDNGETYPSSAHTLVLGVSSLISSANMYEALTRVTSITGLTLVLFALLS